MIPYFRKRGGGKIINISSIAGVGAFPNCAAYCASKGGVVNLTRALAAEFAHEQINVNSIAPGNVATPINAHLRGPGHADYERQMSERTPTRRSFMDPRDMAGAAVFLASDDAKGIHGAILMVDDGWLLEGDQSHATFETPEPASAAAMTGTMRRTSPSSSERMFVPRGPSLK